MNLAAIDIGTNSIHMVIVRVNANMTFDVLHQEKEMVKLGNGVFATNQLTKEAYQYGLDTIRRYVNLADQIGVEEIITAATSAIREARNGGDFLDEVVQQTGISPKVISGKEEARLIFLAVRNAININGENAMVIDIGGGSTESVVGNSQEILFRYSMQLGVRRLLDMFDGEGPVSKETKQVLESHINHVAKDIIMQAKACGFKRVIGTSGTIRTLGEAAYLASGNKNIRSVNAEVVPLSALEKLTQKLLKLSVDKRSGINGINQKRADAIHLGGVLLTQLLTLSGVEEITLCDASLREGLIIDYLNRYFQRSVAFPEQGDLRHRTAAQMARKYNVDFEQKTHVARLALLMFDQLKKEHKLGEYERSLLEFASLLHSVGQYIDFEKYQKHSRYIILHAEMRGFTNEEILLIAHLARYHRKATPKKKHTQFGKLDKQQQHTIKVLASILRMAIGLDITKNQLVQNIICQVKKDTVCMMLEGSDDLNLELWETKRNRKAMEKAFKKEVVIKEQTKQLA